MWPGKKLKEKESEETGIRAEIFTEYQAFSSAFEEIGNNDELVLPRIHDSITGSSGYIHFGEGNRQSQLYVQMYYVSPLHGAICRYKARASTGGGYDIKLKQPDNIKQKADALVFERKNGLKKMVKTVALNDVIHERTYFIVKYDKNKNKPVKITHVGAEKVRTNKGRTWYYLCDDWLTHSGGIKPIRPYRGYFDSEELLLCFEMDSPGQDTYTIPSYAASMNWAFLDGQGAELHKSNVINSIFAAMAWLFPRQPKGDELNVIRQTIEQTKGAKSKKRIIALFANKKEDLPEIKELPKVNNEGLFDAIDDRTDAQICKSHSIDPILMGIRVSGKLGSGTDIAQAYPIFEKNVIIPIRERIEEIFNKILEVFEINAEFCLKKYSIIEGNPVEIDEELEAVLNRFSKLPEQAKTRAAQLMPDDLLKKIIGI